MDPENYLSSSENVAQLQRLYRITEGDRRAYCRDTEVTLLRQRKIIHKLEAEREKILSQVGLGDDQGAVGRVTDLNAMLDVYKRKRLMLHQERQIVQSQESEIQKLEKEIAKLIVGKKKDVKLALTSANQQPTYEPVNPPSKRIEILEDRLQNASVNYNRLLYDGGRLRVDIEGLLKQRNVHRRILRHLNRRMSDLKAQMEGLADDAIRSYNAREVAYQKLQVLKGDHLVDDRLCKSQVQEAQRVLELLKTLFEFVATKNRRRSTMMMTTGGSSTPRRSDRSAQSISHDHHRRRSMKDAAIGDTELFTYTSNLNNKVEELQSEIDGLLKQSQMLQSIKTHQDEEQKDAIKELELLLADVTAKCEDAQAIVVDREKVFGKLKCGIDAMWRIVSRPRAVESSVTAVDDDADATIKPVIVKTIKDIEGSVDELLRNKQYMNKHNGELDVVKMTPSPTSLNKRRPTRVDFQSVCVSHPSLDIMVMPPDLTLPEEADVQAGIPDADVQECRVKTLLKLFIGKSVDDCDDDDADQSTAATSANEIVLAAADSTMTLGVVEDVTN